MSEFLSPAEFAEKVGVPEGTVRRLCAQGSLPGAYRVGHRWRIDMAEFRAGARALPPVRAGRTPLPRDLLARVFESVA